MTVVEHLEELRHRLFLCALAFFIGSVVAYIFYPHILTILTLPLKSGGRIAGIKVVLSIQGVLTAFLVKIKISIFAGFMLALPVILWQLWRFITPGLAEGEKRYAIPFVLGSLALFASGAVVAYFVLPQALGFLLHFAQGFQPIIFIDQYVSFVALMILAFALTFEIPLVLVLLGAAGAVSSAWLRAHRRHAIVLVVIIAAVATPSQDPYSNLLLAVPLYVMFEAAVLIIRFGLRK
jgi:sec-independent protein translocase protein TatC